MESTKLQVPAEEATSPNPVSPIDAQKQKRKVILAMVLTLCFGLLLASLYLGGRFSSRHPMPSEAFAKPSPLTDAVPLPAPARVQAKAEANKPNTPPLSVALPAPSPLAAQPPAPIPADARARVKAEVKPTNPALSAALPISSPLATKPGSAITVPAKDNPVQATAAIQAKAVKPASPVPAAAAIPADARVQAKAEPNRPTPSPLADKPRSAIAIPAKDNPVQATAAIQAKAVKPASPVPAAAPIPADARVQAKAEPNRPTPSPLAAKNPVKPPVVPESEAGSGLAHPKPGDAYVQVGAFVSPYAERWVNVLEQRGFHPIVAEGPNSTVHRVLLGPLGPAQVSDVEAKLREAGIEHFEKIY